MINALIIEDEGLASERLSKLLLEADPKINIIDTLDSIESAINWFNQNNQPDLIFLDIQLADGLSFQIFEYIRIKSPVIFTTAYDEYALKAFELHSIDYLLKPIKIEELKNSIKKYKSIKEYYSDEELDSKIKNALSSFRYETKTYKNRFLVYKGDSLIPVQVNEIAYFFAEEKVVFLVTFAGTKFIINYSLDKLEEMTDPKMFYRASRQYLISSESIKKVHNYFNYKLKVDVIPLTDKDIIISRAKVVEFKKWLTEDGN